MLRSFLLLLPCFLPHSCFSSVKCNNSILNHKRYEVGYVEAITIECTSFNTQWCLLIFDTLPVPTWKVDLGKINRMFLNVLGDLTHTHTHTHTDTHTHTHTHTHFHHLPFSPPVCRRQYAVSPVSSLSMDQKQWSPLYDWKLSNCSPYNWI